MSDRLQQIQAKANEAARRGVIWDSDLEFLVQHIAKLEEDLKIQADALAPYLDPNGDARDLLELRATVQRQTWQPMETAPKDEKAVVLICKEYRDPGVGFWFHDGVRGWWTVNTMPVNPTHWMPLPPLEQK